MERHEETRIVKQALDSHGIKARVKHGTGTAYGWLKIYVDLPPVIHDRDKYGWDHCAGNSECCTKWQETYSRIIAIARQVTNRTGSYDGRINVHM